MFTFVVALVYVILSYIRPEDYYPEIAPYRIMLILGFILLFGAVISFTSTPVKERRLALCLMAAFTLEVCFSEVASGWFGGLLTEIVPRFLPSALVFFGITLGADRLKRVRILMVVMVLCATVQLTESIVSLHTGWHQEDFRMTQPLFDAHDNFTGEYLTRITGTGFISDPNDFAQYLLAILPFAWMAWRKRAYVRNLLILGLTAYFGYGMFLTHSRGAVLGGGVLLLLLLRGRMNSAISGILAGAGLLGMLALNFTGGRAISVDSGADRLALWSDALVAFRHSPLWGVGFNRFSDWSGFMTAHNSFVLCAAELGMMGLVLWCALMVTGVLEMNRVSAWAKQLVSATAAPLNQFSGTMLLRPNRALPQSLGAAAAGLPAPTSPALANNVSPEDAAQFARCAFMLKNSLLAFLVTAWFLSRTYTLTLYIILGLIAALSAAAVETGSPLPAQKKWKLRSFLMASGVLVLLQLMVKFGWVK